MSNNPGNSLSAGLYEILVTVGLEAQMQELHDSLQPEQVKLADAEAANRIAFHLSRVVERSIALVPEKRRVEIGAKIARELARYIDEHIDSSDAAEELPVDPGRILKSIRRRQPDGSFGDIESPLIPLMDTALLTNAPGEPRLGRQIQAEIDSADRIDLLMAFIRRTGLVGLVDPLRRHCERGRSLRVLTTTYTGSTEREALDLLESLGAQVRISYDMSTTRLHAKAWLFQRASGFSTAYVGSSNLTHSAQISGLEWNVRVSGARNTDVIDKIGAVFNSYWEGGDFRTYDGTEFDEQTPQRNASGPQIFLSPVEIRPEPFQERLLEQLALARRHGHHRNLLVAATGTGKTVMAALDYAALRTELPRVRLLFVAHRQEILDQSQATFRHALREPGFGERWSGGQRPRAFDHVFASIQSLRLADLAHLPPDHFDVVIIDEFHHSAASSYARLLEHVEPRELIGLTATPERADGRSILHWFDERIAAELRLWDAIDQHYLSPFVYFGIHDGLDLREVPWRRGRGYDVEGLSNLYTATDSWARKVIQELRKRCDEGQMRALGFCVSIDHARYMARVFEQHGIAARAVWGDSPQDERVSALAALAAGETRIVFSVDLFNEGVDLPSIDTLLMLRPTDSPTLFLQQLGRGLRRAPDKTACLVLDFVGHHRREFRFDRKMRALLGGTRKELAQAVEGGFPYLPAGCHMELDAFSSEIVLRSIRESVPSKWAQKVAELRSLVDAGHAATLAAFIEHSGLDLEDVYSGNRSWTDLCDSAGLATLPAGPQEKTLRRAIGRLLHTDDATRLTAYSELLESESSPAVSGMTLRERRLTRMLVASLVDQAIHKAADVQAGLDLIWEHPQVRAELRELFVLLVERVDHLHQPLATPPEVPLLVHARYSRIEILAAFGDEDAAKVPPWQTGCQWIPGSGADLFAFTLNKTGGAFSPTTRYKDYAVSRDLIHWESQTATRVASDTGQRYIHHVERETQIMLFSRLKQTDRAFWFLGPATYVSHEGERPIAFTWRLQHSLPGDLFAAFAAAVA